MGPEQDSQQETDAAQLRAVLEAAVDGILTIGADGIVVTANAAVSRIFGYRNDELVGQNVSILMPEPDRSRHDGYLSKYLATGERHIIGVGREVVGRRKNGVLFPVYLAVSQVEVLGKQLFTGIVRDISEVKELEMALRAAKDSAERANAAKSDFLSSMSHELRTPMNAILGFGQLIIEDRRNALCDDHRAYMENILEAGAHLLELINDVLDLSRIEAGVIDITTAATDLRVVIDECVTLIRTVASKRAIDVMDATDAHSIPPVMADYVRVKQILLNLLSNAVKYIDGSGAVTIAAEKADGYIRISVTDTGPGIPAHRQREVFERFNRLGRDHGATAGTGIGLAISKQLVERMGGRIGFTSEEGKGSTFWFDLPATEIQPEASAHPGAPGPAAFKVLYIEDNPSNLRLMEHMISHIGGFSLISALSADWALDIVDVWEPDVIMVEGTCQANQYTDAITLIRSHAGCANTPIIALACTDEESALHPDYLRCLPRPTRLADIRTALHEAVASLRTT